MKTFRWVEMHDVKGNRIITLFDITHYRDEGTILAVGSIVPVGDEFRPIVTYPEKITTEETMSLGEAMIAIEQKLMSDGIISDGDEVEEE